MKITNKFGLPETLVNACRIDSYSKGASDYSVTEIMSSPRIVRLRQKHYKEMEQDVTDKLWSMLGTAIHSLMEKADAKNHIKEERLFSTIDGVVLSGAIDLQEYEDGMVNITDYKYTSAWALRQDKQDWVQQLNIYAWLVFRNTGRMAKKLSICAIIRDWSRREAMTNPDYPQGQAQMVEVDIWDLAKTEEFIKHRIELHKEAKFAADMDEELPECSEDERWLRPTKYAVMKEGRKSAVRVFDWLKEANDLIGDAPLLDRKKFSVQVRKGEAVKCTGDFCGVSKFCSQFKRESEDVGS